MQAFIRGAPTVVNGYSAGTRTSAPFKCLRIPFVRGRNLERAQLPVCRANRKDERGVTVAMHTDATEYERSLHRRRWRLL